MYPTSKVNALIPDGMIIEGNIIIDDELNLIIDGAVLGCITKHPTNDKRVTLMINSTASVSNHIEVDSVVISGAQLCTTITAGQITLCDKAQFKGHLRYRDLTIESGSMITGELSLKKADVIQTTSSSEITV